MENKKRQKSHLKVRSKSAVFGLLLAVLLAGMLSACSQSSVNEQQPALPPELKEELPVNVYKAPEDLPVNYRSYDFKVLAGEEEIDLYNGGANSWNEQVSYGYFDMPGRSKISITPNFSFDSFEIVPRSLGIKGERQGDAISFELSRQVPVSLVLDGNYKGKVLHLFAQTPETDIPDKNDPNVIFFEPGFHDLGDYGEPPLMLQSNQTLYISGGAVVRGRVRADNANNITIRGRGILLNDYRSNDEFDDIALTLGYVSDSEVRDIIVNRDAASWTAAMHGSSDIRVTNYKAVSPRFASSDGFNINSSHDIVFDGAFIHSADDAVAIKGLSHEEPKDALPIYNITYKNAQLWADANNAIGIGAETVAPYFKNITFSNIDILHNYDDRDHPDVLPDRSAINIFALQGTEFSGITFENIRVEKAKRFINIQMAETFYFGALQGNWAWPGSISGITYKNIESYSDGSNEIKLEGWSNDRLISDINFENIKVNGKKLKKDDPLFTVNEYVKDIKVK
ncbi:hypothetical protein [Paenibacillus sp. IITD108]|uniref:hypothetical protein n=1 Tax=Paenibacillus sp. IITD108 TaxID=3116649 RepID=UPI002F3F4F0A